MNRLAAATPRRTAAIAPKPAPIKVMIVDDSPIARAVLSRMLTAAGDIAVVAEAGSARDALDALDSVRVDTILLDVEMPGTSGLDALPELLRRGHGARVLIVSSLCEDGADASVRALALGATDTISKPGTGSFGGQFAKILAERVRALGRSDRAGAVAMAGLSALAPASPPLKLRALPDYRLSCLALGASTGGLHAIGEFLRALSGRIAAPILITQHLPPIFMPFFARQIEAASGRLARVAEDNMRLVPDEILIAPGDAHLGLHRHGDDVRVRLSDQPVSSGCRPSVDPMLAALGESYGPGGLAVIFSGMGRDGLVGSAALVEMGGGVIVQDEASSAVWGMPRAVAEAGLASAILPPSALARRVASRADGARQ